MGPERLEYKEKRENRTSRVGSDGNGQVRGTDDQIPASKKGKTVRNTKTNTLNLCNLHKN